MDRREWLAMPAVGVGFCTQTKQKPTTKPVDEALKFSNLLSSLLVDFLPDDEQLHLSQVSISVSRLDCEFSTFVQRQIEERLDKSTAIASKHGRNSEVLESLPCFGRHR